MWRGQVALLLAKQKDNVAKSRMASRFVATAAMVRSDVSPERNEPRKRSLEGCALAVGASGA